MKKQQTPKPSFRERFDDPLLGPISEAELKHAGYGATSDYKQLLETIVRNMQKRLVVVDALLLRWDESRARAAMQYLKEHKPK